MPKDLFEESFRARVATAAPLAVRMRPRILEEFVGQEHFLAPGKLLRRTIEADRLQSVIFFGPPGVGKTALAQVIAGLTKAEFVEFDATSSGVKEVRAALDEARSRLETGGQRTVLFIDEIHRFNRAQQDVLLGDVERGVVILIGATTENPYFSVNSPLLSRSTVFHFQPLAEEHIVTLLQRALADKERGLGKFDVRAADEALAHLATACDGDARRLLGSLEIAVLSQMKAGGLKRGKPLVIDLAVAEESIQQKQIVYDGTGDEHYDSVSAFIKSMRGSDPDAAMYWMARMLEGGEDPRFIARRIVICAAEDVGNADPMALVVANSALQISEFVGLPEAQLPLAQAAVYIACAPKSNAVTSAIYAARDDVKENRTIPVPVYLRDKSYHGAAKLGHGIGYEYSHKVAGAVSAQDYLGVSKIYYEPTDRGYEQKISARLVEIRKVLEQGKRDAAAERAKKEEEPEE